MRRPFRPMVRAAAWAGAGSRRARLTAAKATRSGPGPVKYLPWCSSRPGGPLILGLPDTSTQVLVKEGGIPCAQDNRPPGVLVVACVGGPLIGLMYLLIARSSRAGKRQSELTAVCRCGNDAVNPRDGKRTSCSRRVVTIRGDEPPPSLIRLCRTSHADLESVLAQPPAVRMSDPQLAATGSARRPRPGLRTWGWIRVTAG
jgi:hypothetical protein